MLTSFPSNHFFIDGFLFMIKYIIRRLIASGTLFVMSIVIFLLLRVLPGDPARLFAGDLATEQEVQALRERLNLNKPITVQYGYFLKDLSRGNLGDSMRTKEPVLYEIMARFPNTLKLAIISIILASIFGVVGGVIAAVKHNTAIDMIISTGTLFGVAMPVYWLALMLILVFSINLKWLPAAGNQYPIKSAILPSITLALFSIALITRITRAFCIRSPCPRIRDCSSLQRVEGDHDFIWARLAKCFNPRGHRDWSPVWLFAGRRYFDGNHFCLARIRTFANRINVFPRLSHGARPRFDLFGYVYHSQSNC